MLQECMDKCDEEDGLKYDFITAECVSNCKESQYFDELTLTCKDYCDLDDGEVYQNGKCQSICDEGTFWDGEVCWSLCAEDQYFVKEQGCVSRCDEENGELWVEGQCIFSCPVGQAWNFDSKRCQNCSMNNCAACENLEACKTCKPYYLLVNGECIECPENCSTCSLN